MEGEPVYTIGAFRADAAPVLQQAAKELGLGDIAIISDRKILVESRPGKVDYIDIPSRSIFAAVRIPDKICPVTNQVCDRPTYPFLEKVIELYTAA